MPYNMRLMADGNPHILLLQYAADKLRGHSAQVLRCADMLSDDQLWFRPNENSNSVANLLLHLRGNVAQWILGGVCGQPIERNRRAEFAQRERIPREDLISPLEETVASAVQNLKRLPASALTNEYVIQEYRVTGTAAVVHVVEHFAFHTGQIVTTTKWLLDVDLSLYDEEGHWRGPPQSGAP
jgi:uncharacterized damage-inducible protein DinB